MNTLSKFSDQWDGVRRGFATQRLAHAYCLIGSPRGSAAAFAEAMLKLIFCSAPADQRPCGACSGCTRVEKRIHPDVLWVEPQSRGRSILIEDMRQLIQRLQQTSYEGGWKAAVIAYADRMNESSANAFLKTLEEPAGQTLLLLLTDSPHRLLPTILSRCQPIMLSRESDQLDGEWRETLLTILREAALGDLLGISIFSERLRGLLDEVKAQIEAEEPEETYVNPEETRIDKEAQARQTARIQANVLETRARLLTMVMQWQRDLLLCALGAETDELYFPEDKAVLREQSSSLTVPQALARVRAVETMGQRLNRNMPAATVFETGFGELLLKR